MVFTTVCKLRDYSKASFITESTTEALLLKQLGALSDRHFHLDTFFSQVTQTGVGMRRPIELLPWGIGNLPAILKVNQVEVVSTGSFGL
jgi:hypothetical protein